MNMFVRKALSGDVGCFAAFLFGIACARSVADCTKSCDNQMEAKLYTGTAGASKCLYATAGTLCDVCFNNLQIGSGVCKDKAGSSNGDLVYMICDGKSCTDDCPNSLGTREASKGNPTNCGMPIEAKQQSCQTE